MTVARSVEVVLQKTVYIIDQNPVYSTVSPIGRIHRFKNQALGMGTVLLTIT